MEMAPNTTDQSLLAQNFVNATVQLQPDSRKRTRSPEPLNSNYSFNNIQKRIRTSYTSDQLMKLESQYLMHQYLERAQRIELAQQLNLTEHQVKIWFQNRRMKDKKRQNKRDQSGLTDTGVSSTSATPTPSSEPYLGSDMEAPMSNEELEEHQQIVKRLMAFSHFKKNKPEKSVGKTMPVKPTPIKVMPLPKAQTIPGVHQHQNWTNWYNNSGFDFAQDTFNFLDVNYGGYSQSTCPQMNKENEVFSTSSQNGTVSWFNSTEHSFYDDKSILNL